MCLLLYLATAAPVKLGAAGKLTVEEVGSGVLQQLRPAFSKPEVRYVGVESRCSCAFRHVNAEEPMEYFDGMFADEGEEKRAEAIAVMTELLDLVHDHLQDGVEIYPVWSGEQGSLPKGTCGLRAGEIRPDRFFFVEGFLYTLRA